MGNLLNLELTCPHCDEQTEIKVSLLLTPQQEETCRNCTQPIYRKYNNLWLIELPFSAFFSFFFLFILFALFVLFTQGPIALWQDISSPQIKPYAKMALLAFTGTIVIAKLVAYASVEYITGKPKSWKSWYYFGND